MFTYDNTQKRLLCFFGVEIPYQSHNQLQIEKQLCANETNSQLLGTLDKYRLCD